MKKLTLGRFFLVFIILLIPTQLFAQQVTVSLGPSGDTNYRWKDIAGNLYSQSYINQSSPFPYDQANVRLTYETISNSFSGKLRASGLKPNFSYQMKLEGKPSEDAWANQQIGNLGRWWSNIGYMLFDFITTDHEGKASLNFVLNSSFHVLWNTLLNSRNPGANDSEIRFYNIIGFSTDEAYDVDLEPVTVGIYAEWESGKPVPGDVQLPDGQYKVTFRLTEESFHKNGEYEGYWASVMEHSGIEFTINNLIPVELSAFSGRYSSGVVELSWTTLTEMNNLGYHIYRRKDDNSDYSRITQDLIKGAGTTSTTHDYIFRDADIQTGNVYQYKLADINFEGGLTFHSPILVETISHDISCSLHPCFPNPFNATTSIRFQIMSPAEITVNIYNLNGVLIKTLARCKKPQGYHSYNWDGVNSQGVPVSSGCYFVSLEADGYRDCRKVLLLK